MSNLAIIAAAGSGKTDRIVDDALSDSSARSLIVTYTIENAGELTRRLREKAGRHPENVVVLTWFEFILRHGIKPYQSFLTSVNRAKSLNFEIPRPQYARRNNVDRYYFDKASNVFSDSASDLACRLDAESGGLVVSRLELLFDNLMVDEMQDLAGYDLDFVELLLASALDVTLVGDPRQAIYSTNRSNRNSQYRRAAIMNWLSVQESKGRCKVETLDWSHRCNQAVCDFADALYPSHAPTRSLNDSTTTHGGIFVVRKADVPAYITHVTAQEDHHTCQVLRWDKNTDTLGLAAINYGKSKGLGFCDVVIVPTGTFADYLKSNQPLAAGSVAKVYVAVTRARHSVAIVDVDGTLTVPGATIWTTNVPA